MKLRTLAVLFTLVCSAAAFAQEPVRRTVIVRDGKVITDTGETIELDRDLLGGKRAWLGVSLLDLTPELRDHFGASKEAGILVSSIAENSPAAKAGVKTGDIIVAVDGKEVDSASDLRRELREKKEGDSVRLEVLRGRSRHTFVANVVEREGPRLFARDLEGLPRMLHDPRWRARIESLGDCGSLQTRIKELEGRLKDLEKKLEK